MATEQRIYLLVFLLFAQTFVVFLCVFTLEELESGDGTGTFSVQHAPNALPLLHTDTHRSVIHSVWSNKHIVTVRALHGTGSDGPHAAGAGGSELMTCSLE